MSKTFNFRAEFQYTGKLFLTKVELSQIGLMKFGDCTAFSNIHSFRSLILLFKILSLYKAEFEYTVWILKNFFIWIKNYREFSTSRKSIMKILKILKIIIKESPLCSRYFDDFFYKSVQNLLATYIIWIFFNLL